MMDRFYRAALIPCLWLIGSQYAHTSESVCVDASSIDLANATIVTAGISGDANQLVTSFNGPAGKRVIRFRNGAFRHKKKTTDDGDDGDWTADLKSTRMIQPNPGVSLREAEIGVSDTDGTGSWVYVLVFACHGGRLKRIFQFSDAGVQQVRTQGNLLRVVQGMWSKEDSHAGPSQQRTLTYRWNTVQDRYVLQLVSRPRAMNTYADRLHKADVYKAQ